MEISHYNFPRYRHKQGKANANILLMNILISISDAFSNILCIIDFVLDIFIYVSFFIKTEF